ncbi:hypothetical protein TWF281_011666 [Arthrobotrys megalospora]
MECLPNELLDRIAFYLSSKDLGSFSLACHRIRNISLRHLFRRIRLTYGLSDEALQESEERYSFYVQRAQHVREIHLYTESKSFYHYNVQGCHGTIVREALMPFGQVERLALSEYSETSWADFFSIIKRQLETKPNLRFLCLQPNFIERAREPRAEPGRESEHWLQQPLPRLQTLRLSFFAMDKKVWGPEIRRVTHFINIVARLQQVTDSLQKLILDGSLQIQSQMAPPLACKPLSFPQLRSLSARDLRLSGAPISSFVAPETLNNVRVHSSPRPESWGYDTEILDRFLPFSNLEELQLSHSHDYFRCSTCKDTHRIFHVGITPAFEDSKILAQHLPRLEVVKWYSAYVSPLLFRYKITRNKDGSANLILKRSTFKKVDFQEGWVCSDYQGKYPDLEILPCNDESTGLPPRINWQDITWFEPSN